MPEQVYPNIREYLLTRYNSRRKDYSKAIYVLVGIVILIIITVAIFTCNKEEEPQSAPDPCLGLILFIAFIIGFIMLMKEKDKAPAPPPPPPKTIDPPFTLAGRDEFFCYHCYKVILTEKIHPINCAVCSTSNTFFEIIDKCTRCNLPLRFFVCPHCHETLDFLNEPYNPEEIKRRILGQG